MADQSPQSTRKTPEQRKAEAAAAAEQAKKDAATVEKALTAPADATIEQQMGVTLIRKARDLHAERERVTTQTASNRDMLRGMRDQDLLTADQKAAVDVLYPTPKRNGDDAPAPAPAAPAATTTTPGPASGGAAGQQRQR